MADHRETSARLPGFWVSQWKLEPAEGPVKGAGLQEVRWALGGDEPPASLLSASSAHEVQPLHCKPVHTRLGAKAPHAQGALARLGVCRLTAIKRRGGTAPKSLVSLPVSSQAAVERRLRSNRGCRSSVSACQALGPASQTLGLPAVRLRWLQISPLSPGRRSFLLHPRESGARWKGHRQSEEEALGPM